MVAILTQVYTRPVTSHIKKWRLAISLGSPQTYSESGQDADKFFFPYRSLVSCKFAAGVWMVVAVDGFTAAMKFTSVTQ